REIHGIAANVNHTVDRTRTAENFSACVVNAPTIHLRLWFRLIAPVDSAADRISECRRHVNENIPEPIAPASFENQNFLVGMRAQTIRQYTARRTSADDDEIISVHKFLSYHSRLNCASHSCLEDW